MLRRFGILAVAVTMAVGLLVSCGTTEQAAYEPVTQGIDPSTFDDAYLPCEDFYHYVNASWQAENPVPPEYGSWGLAYEIYENNNRVLRQICEEAAEQSAAEGTIKRKIGDFYYSAMDTAAIEAAGVEPLQDDLARIDAIADLGALQQLVADYHAEGNAVFFDAGAEQDVTNHEQVILYISQGGLGLPDRDYYTRDDEESETLRKQYVAHIARMLGMFGIDEAAAQAQADAIMAVETRLAEASLTNVEARNPASWYDWKTIADADKITPHFSWGDYLARIGVPEVEAFSMTPQKFFVQLDDVFAETSLDDLKAYVRWHLIDNSAPYLSSDIVQADFDFSGTILGGRKELRDRWKRALSRVNAYLGEGLGQLYVEKTFPPASKQKALEMVTNLQKAFRARLKKVTWMSEETREKALAKLDAFGQKIGYPDKWRDYSALEVDRGHFLNNVRRGRTFDVHRNLDRLGKPIDPTEWEMNPQTVNAYYHPLKNEIVFPAGILQPPYFDGEADDALNYGAMGAIIGHEMTHGFDDMGSQFDANGTMANWWTEEDREHFDARTAKLVEQFNQYTVAGGLPVNGKLTLGENIADLGGLLISFDALQLASEGKEDPMIDGLTREQRFFLSYAQAWRSNHTEEAIKLQVNTDPHSPDIYRVLGPLSNIPAFKNAFGCSENSSMVRSADERVEIW